MFAFESWVVLSYLVWVVANLVFYYIKKEKSYLKSALGYIYGILYIAMNVRQIWRGRIRVHHIIRKVKDDQLVGDSIQVPKQLLPHILLTLLRRSGLISGCRD